MTDHLIDRLLHPQRLTEILASINVRHAERALELDKRVAALQSEVAEADDKLRRLYRMVEEGRESRMLLSFMISIAKA